MNANTSPDSPSRKQAVLPGCAFAVFQLLRSFWVTLLALLIVVFIGLRGGWATPRQWSDAFFWAAIAQVFAAAVSAWSPPGESIDASTMRYVDRGNIYETQKFLILDMVHRWNFAVRLFIGALVTGLISAIFLLS